MIKKVIALFLIFFLLNVNFAYAENWVTITAENGKSADLDLDSIQMAIDTVEYNTRTQNDEYIYINKMSTELYKEGIPTAVIERSKYKNDLSENNKISDEKIEIRDYRVLKPGTLQSEIFDVLSKELTKKKFTRGKSTWNKYLKRQRKDIYEKWEPSGNYFNSVSSFASPVYINRVILTVDKDGIIQNKQNDYDSVLTDLSVIEPLPDDYTAETFQLDVKMNYYKYAGAKMNTKKPVVKQISPVHSEITIAKNKRPPVIGQIQLFFLWCFKKIKQLTLPDAPDNILCLVYLPFAIAGIAVYATGIIISGIFCFLSGVDMDDL